MAVRFSDSGQGYTATTGLPTGTTWSVTFWVMIMTDMNRFTDFFNFESDAAGVYLGTAATGTSLQVGDWNADNPIGAMTAGTWYRVGLTVNAGTAVTYFGTATGALNATTDTVAAPNPALRMGIGVAAGNTANYLNGRIASVKVWQAALSASEIATELGQYAAARTSNLLRRHDFITASTADDSGNGRALTGGTGATTEASPVELAVATGPEQGRMLLSR